MNLILQDFYHHLNDAVLTTNNFADGSKYRKRDKVAEFAYCGLNPMYRAYISLDLDYPGAARRYEELAVPPPSIVTTNRANGHCHYLYRLVTPVAYHKASRTQPQAYLEAIQDELARLLKADTAYSHTLTKNPLHDRWLVDTFPTRYHLSDFTEYFHLPALRTTREVQSGHTIRGRNDELFHTLRLWAYQAVQKHTHEALWLHTVEQQAHAINAGFSSPLPYKEVRDTARATSRWVWRHRHELHVRPKVLSFTDETATERMQAGAAYTNAQRSLKALDTLTVAVQELQPIYGSKLNAPILSDHTGQNIKTVRKYLPQALQAAKSQ